MKNLQQRIILTSAAICLLGLHAHVAAVAKNDSLAQVKRASWASRLNPLNLIDGGAKDYFFGTKERPSIFKRVPARTLFAFAISATERITASAALKYFGFREKRDYSGIINDTLINVIAGIPGDEVELSIRKISPWNRDSDIKKELKSFEYITHKQLGKLAKFAIIRFIVSAATESDFGIDKLKSTAIKTGCTIGVRFMLVPMRKAYEKLREPKVEENAKLKSIEPKKDGKNSNLLGTT
ncbi:hypothetical protein HOL34_00035 [bacterium]|nr:hypothetical protein [bacterium]MBT4577979.1 hypothetical protein [bacterium]MBT6130775.1 hypothetical protein [bacterium]MBT6528489.1 hypothetical protein [bacterium]